MYFLSSSCNCGGVACEQAHLFGVSREYLSRLSDRGSSAKIACVVEARFSSG